MLHFGMAGVAGLVVDMAVLYLLLAVGLDRFSGRALSFLAAVWTTWRINRRYAFSATAATSQWQEWWRYLLAMLGGGAVNFTAYSAIVLLARTPAPWLPLAAVAGGSVVGMVVNFLSAKLFVFKRHAAPASPDA